MTERKGTAGANKERLLLIEADIEAGRRLTARLQEQNRRVVWCASAGEAIAILTDAFFADAGFNGMLISHDLPDGSAIRVVLEFRARRPMGPVALMFRQEDVAAKAWAFSPGVQLFSKPLHSRELQEWLDRSKPSVEMGAAS